MPPECSPFERVLASMRRHGLGREGRDIYFTAHIKLDPTHAEELILGIESQSPALEPWQRRQILRGAEIAVAGATAMYDRMLDYLRAIDRRTS